MGTPPQRGGGQGGGLPYETCSRSTLYQAAFTGLSPDPTVQHTVLLPTLALAHQVEKVVTNDRKGGGVVVADKRLFN